MMNGSTGNNDPLIHFGAYIIATRDVFDDNGVEICAQGELALIFSRHRQTAKHNNEKPVDVLFERGKSIHGIAQNIIKQNFRAVYTDPDFVICGCSSNDGWDKAKKILGLE